MPHLVDSQQILWFERPGHMVVKEAARSSPAAGQVEIAVTASAVSAGTELLAYRGQLPPDLPLDANIAGLQEQAVQYPLRFGYAAVGQVVTIGEGVDDAWLGRRVFAFAPHGSHAVIAAADVVPLPDDIAWEDALFLPNMETAVSFVMDGRPVIGENVLVVGQGVVGLLTTMALAQLPLTSLITVDRFERRRMMARELGATAALDPQDSVLADSAADLAYELSGSPAALDVAIGATGYGGRVVIGSWYGTKQAPLDLGAHFHRSHMTLISSQVSTLHPRWRGRWTKERRLDVAWEMIRRQRPSRLISHRMPLAEAAELYALLDQRPGEALQTVLTINN